MDGRASRVGVGDEIVLTNCGDKSATSAKVHEAKGSLNGFRSLTNGRNITQRASVGVSEVFWRVGGVLGGGGGATMLILG